MFYKQEDVNAAIVCGICQSVYKNPRLLPCSESACYECIQLMIKTDPNQEFACKFCNKKHLPGRDGFPLNGALIKLLKAKAGNVYRNERVERLKEKLVDIKSKCDKFQLSLDNGVDQIRKHCTQLRNQVDLETERLINEAHKFNESLLVEINNYEEECIKSFKCNSNKENDKFNKFIIELNEFYSGKTKYLTEFNIDEKVVEEAVQNANNHLGKLKIEDVLLKNTLFNGKEAEFIKRQNKIDRTLLGTLVYKSLDLDLISLNELKLGDNHNSSFLSSIHELKFGDNVIKSPVSSIHLFKNHDGNNFAFYLNENNYMCMSKFDNNGKVVKQIINALKIGDRCKVYPFNQGGNLRFQLDLNPDSSSRVSQLKVTQLLDNFVFYVKLTQHWDRHGFICDHQINENHGPIEGLFFILDQDFNYIKHNASFRDDKLLHIAANSSRILWIDSRHNFHLLDKNLTLVNDQKFLRNLKNQTNELDIVDFQMNDKYVFFLCDNNLDNQKSFSANYSTVKCSCLLKIFTIDVLVKKSTFLSEIETNANQIKLAPKNHFVLFDSCNRIAYLYDQTEGKHFKLEEINLTQSLEADLKINRDQSNCLVFHNSQHMKYTSLY
jgi:hypothetical protein